MKQKNWWKNNHVQFIRLLSEMNAVGVPNKMYGLIPIHLLKDEPEFNN